MQVDWQADWIEMVGYTGTGLTVVAYGMKQIVPLRIAAILSSVAFLSYGLLTQSYPLVLMEVLLMPINIYRLVETLLERRRTPKPA
jgi:CRP/FNR family cyclic AMP-dependent transcriptional regulator